MPVAPEHAGGSPFFFAWVDATETTFGPEHHVYDEYVFSFTLAHSEGDFATLELEIKNPFQGLLAAGRKIWIWFAYDSGSEPEPLFFGRLIGLPSDMFNEVVRLQFTARPLDVAEQKALVAEELKVLPSYDPVFIDADKRDDPDTVLEGYSALWHYDRVTHEVTASDILVGEDGVESFGPGDAFYDSVSIQVNAAPINAISVKASVSWTQQATGTIDFGTHFFLSAGGLIESWPKAGTQLQAGWSVEQSTLKRSGSLSPVSYELSYTNREKEHRDGDLMSWNENFSGYPGTILDIHYTEIVIGDPETGTGARSRQEGRGIRASFPSAEAGFVLRYDAKRGRIENIAFTLTSDLQAVLLDDGETAEAETLEVNGSDVGLPLEDAGDSDGGIPIGDLSRRAYFPIERGNLSVQHLILRAAARLKMGARVGRVSWECTFDRAIELSLRKNAVLNDYRLPGSQASGKVVSYEMTGDGDAAAFLGKVTIACTVGLDNALTFSEGDPIYVDDDYVDDDYQEREGEVIAIGAGNVGYSPPSAEINDDDIVFPLTRSQAIVVEDIHQAQIASATIADGSIDTTSGDPPGEDFFLPSKRLTSALNLEVLQQRQIANTQSAWYELELKSMTGGPFENQYDLAVTHLRLPKQLDLTSP